MARWVLWWFGGCCDSLWWLGGCCGDLVGVVVMWWVLWWFWGCCGGLVGVVVACGGFVQL